MAFLNPALLWGILGISVPIGIHLLNRYRQKEMHWGAMHLLRRAVQMRARRIQLEDKLLLFLRCLAILLIALALARPTLRAAGLSWLGAETRGVVIALDGSFSMAHRSGVRDRFELALEKARTILESLEPGDPLGLMLLGNHPRIALHNTGYEPARVDEVLETIKTLQEGLNLESGLRDIQGLMSEMKAVHRECYILTDAQGVTWGSLSEEARRSLEAIGSAATLFLISCETENHENLAITRFERMSGSLLSGSTARFMAEVRNTGDAAQENLAVHLVLDGKTIDQRMVNLARPGETVSVPLFARFPASGPARLSARLSRPDSLSLDDSRHAAAHVYDSVQILCVDGQPSSVPFQGEVDYLVMALRPESRQGASTGFRIKTVPWLSLTSQRPADYQVIVLANVPDIPDRWVTSLKNFVEEGGGLILFLGNNIDPGLLHARMRQESNLLLPGELLSPVGDPQAMAEGMAFSVSSPDHPLAQPLRHLPRELLDTARFYRFFQVKPDPESRVILSLGGEAAPLLLEKSLGLGHVLLFTSTADKEWTNLVLNPAYPVLLHQAIAYLTSHARERAFVVGQPVAQPLPPQSEESRVTFIDPSGKEQVVQVTQRDGGRVAELDHPEEAGFYEARIETATPGTESHPPLIAAVNLEPAESNVRALSQDALRASLKNLPVKILPPAADLREQIREGRVGRELWRPLLLLGLVVLFAELALSRRFARTHRALKQ